MTVDDLYKITDGATGKTVADGINSNFEKIVETLAKVSFDGDVVINGSISATGGFYDTSDKRLKFFCHDVKVDLDKLSELSKKYFAYKNNPYKTHIGVSAQEIKEIYPEIVEENKYGYLTVDYSKLSVIALAAIDQLNERLKKLEKIVLKDEHTN